MVYSDLDNDHTPKDPDEVQCMTSMWCKFVWGALSSHANTLAVMNRTDEMGVNVDTMNAVSSQLQQYEENISASLQTLI